MDINHWILSVVNRFASIVFLIMTTIGLFGIFEFLGDDGQLQNQMISYACLFLVGMLGLIAELIIYNLRLLRK